MAKQTGDKAAAKGARWALVLALGAAATLSGCAAQELLPKDYSELPESPDVEEAPWPRLADGPTALESTEAKAKIARGDVINQDLEGRVTKLQTEAELLVAKPGQADALEDRAERARARAAALAAEE